MAQLFGVLMKKRKVKANASAESKPLFAKVRRNQIGTLSPFAVVSTLENWTSSVVWKYFRKRLENPISVVLSDSILWKYFMWLENFLEILWKFFLEIKLPYFGRVQFSSGLRTGLLVGLFVSSL